MISMPGTMRRVAAFTTELFEEIRNALYSARCPIRLLNTLNGSAPRCIRLPIRRWCTAFYSVRTA